MHHDCGRLDDLHKLRESPENPYPLMCTDCGGRFTDEETLRYHTCPATHEFIPLVEKPPVVLDFGYEFMAGWNAAIEAAAKLADSQRNVRVHCDYLPRMLRNLKPLPKEINPVQATEMPEPDDAS
jgi:hypothetical protein